MPDLPTFVFLAVLFPLLSLVFKLRARRRRLSTAAAGSVTPLATRSSSGSGIKNAADEARRRLQQNNGSALRAVWREVSRMVGDTVRMSGRGLV